MSLFSHTSTRRQRTWEALKFAFRVSPSKPLGEEDLQLLESVAEAICSRGMAAPALLALESSRPMSFLGSQALVAIKPFVDLLVSTEKYDRFTAILERRDGIEALIDRIGRMESKKQE